MIEYVTMGQVESIIENYYKEHHSVLSFYATLVYLKQHGETSLQVSSIPDFSKWNLNDLPGLLDLFARIPIPVMVNEDNDVVENIQRNYYGKTTNIFKQPHEKGAHQGVIAQVAAYEYSTVEDILNKAKEKGEAPFIFLLDDIEDPHNLGAIIRTANLAGAHGVIIPKRHAAGLTSTVAKTSAGALNYTPVAKVSNLGQTIEELKKEGMWFVCADMGGDLMYNLNLTGPMGVVIGNEGEGVSRLVKEKCDFVAAIPMKGDIDSLNASVAAGILAYEVVRQRMK